MKYFDLARPAPLSSTLGGGLAVFDGARPAAVFPSAGNPIDYTTRPQYDTASTTADSAEHKIVVTPTVADDTNYAFSIYAEANELDHCAILFTQKNGGTAFARFDLTNGQTMGSTADAYGIVDAGGGEYRCWARHGSNHGATAFSVAVLLADALGNMTYAGTIGDGVIFRAPQLEAADSPTVYNDANILVNDYDLSDTNKWARTNVTVSEYTGVITLTAANAVSSTASSTASITQIHELAGANAATSSVGGTGALTVDAVTCVGENTSTSGETSTASITQVHELAGANAASASSASTGEISIGGITLTSANATSLTAVSVNSIMQVHTTLAGAAEASVTSLTTPAITTGEVTLTAANATTSSVTTGGGITQEHNLGGTAASSATVASSSSITQVHTTILAALAQSTSEASLGAITLGALSVILNIVEKDVLLALAKEWNINVKVDHSVDVEI